MPRFVWVIAPLVFAVPVQAEIFKCVGKDGAVLYQNFKCEVDSLGSLPSAPTLAKPVPIRDHEGLLFHGTIVAPQRPDSITDIELIPDRRSKHPAPGSPADRQRRQPVAASTRP